MFSQVSVCPQSASRFTARPFYGAVGTHPTGLLSCIIFFLRAKQIDSKIYGKICGAKKLSLVKS